jgi:hypothetical protein
LEKHIGLDFDNTIVKYDEVFHKYGVNIFGMPKRIPQTKTSVKEYFWDYKNEGGWEHWVELQGIVYGEKMLEAKPTPRLEKFLEHCQRNAIRVSISSHKTEFPKRGPQVNLWDSAWQWLEENLFSIRRNFKISKGDIFFEPERSLKILRIKNLGCTVFVDDLIEVFNDSTFPSHVKKILYDPHNQKSHVKTDVISCKSWEEITFNINNFYTLN